MTATIRAAVVAYLTQAWGSLTAYRDDDIDRWVATILPTVSAGLGQVAALTDAHLANVIATLADDRPRPLGVRPQDVSVDALRGVPAAEVYRRAGVTVWTALAGGADLADAVRRGLDRAEEIVTTDLQLAKTHTARDVLSADKRVTGYRRVLNGTSCKLCVVASTRIFQTDQLQPNHVRCDCGVSPVIGDKDPAHAFNRELLSNAKRSGISAELSLEQAATRARKALATAEASGDAAKVAGARRRVQHAQRQVEEFRGEHGTIRTVKVHEHGEIGPVLTDATHQFASI